MINLPKINEEDFGYGILRYQLADSGITVIVVATIADKRETVDMWGEVVQKTVNNWPPNQPIALLYDCSVGGLSFTQYSRQKATEAYTYFPKTQRSYIAMLLPNTIISKLISSFINFNKARQPHVHIIAGTKFLSLHEWLQQQAKQPLYS